MRDGTLDPKLFFKIEDCLTNSGFKINLWLPPEQFSRPSNIGLTNFRIIHRQRLGDYLRFSSGNLQDFIGKIEDSHFPRGTDIHSVMIVAQRQPGNAIDQIGDVAKTTRLAAVAKYG